jgi:uncharacterized protein YjbI with pentapeptide repeats
MEISPTAIWIAIAIYLLLSSVLVAKVPALIAPLGKRLSNSEEIDVLDLQNKVRQTVIQVCGGIGFLFSVFMALSAQDSSNRDLKAKYDRETAELFVKAVESESPEALYALAHVAQRDTKNYHEEIFQMLSSLIRTLSREACRTGSEAEEKAVAKIRVAFRLLHERAVSNDPYGIAYNIEHSCLNDSDISVPKAEWGKYRGLVGIRASGSTMLRIDFTRTEIQSAEFMGITAGDRHNPGWDQEPHRYELNDLDAQGAPKWRAERRKFVAHFIDANLTGAKFNGAGLEGADFSGAKLGGAVFDGANISRGSFRGAQDLTVDQFRFACVDDAKSQPVFDEPLASQIKGVPVCQ